METAVIDCEIKEVMECWPLELQVLTDAGLRFFSLTENARVVRGTEDVGPGQLAPGIRIRLYPNTSTDGTGTSVDRVEIVSHP